MNFKVTFIFLCLTFGTHSVAQTAKASIYQDSLNVLIKKSSIAPEQTIKISDSLMLLAKEQHDIKRYASLVLAKGTAYSFLGKNTEALNHQMKAFKIFDSINDPTGKVVSLVNISYSHVHLQNHKKAKGYLLEALEMTDSNNSKLLMSIYANLGNTCVEAGDLSEGIGYYEKSLTYYKKNDNAYGQAMIYHGMAMAYQKLQNTSLAERYCLLALEQQKKTDSDYALSGIALTLGEIYLEQQKWELSKKYLNMGREAAERINSLYFLETYYKNMMQWHKAKGNFQSALENYEKFTTLKDSLYSIENTKSNSELEEKFQNELKSNEIQLLKTQKELATAEIEKNRFWALILILITILCLAAIIVLYQSYKVNKKSNELLKMEKVQLAERNRLLESENILVQFETLKTQVSPHFLFNSLSALTSLIKTDPEKAMQFTKEFSKIFRSTLELKEKNLITLKEELEHVKSYLYLQKMRFDSNLITHISIDSEYLNDYLPPFSLQMVIENAIKHNIITIESPLTIEIFAKNDFLIVTNNLQPRQITEDSTKTGVKNITSRYKYISALEPTFEIVDTLFYVKLPLIKEES